MQAPTPPPERWASAPPTGLRARYRLPDGALSPAAYPVVAQAQDSAGRPVFTLALGANADGSDRLQTFPEHLVAPRDDAGASASWAAFRAISELEDTMSATSQSSFTSLSSYGEFHKTPSGKAKRGTFSRPKNAQKYVDVAVELLSECLEPRSAVLEIGSKRCTGLPGLATALNTAGSLWGIAMDPTERQEAVECLAKEGLQGRAQVFDRTPAWRIVEPQSVDGILLTYVLEGLDPDDATILLSECYACLKPSGHLAVVACSKCPLRPAVEQAGFSADVVKSHSGWGWEVEVVLASVAPPQPGGLSSAKLAQALAPPQSEVAPADRGAAAPSTPLSSAASRPAGFTSPAAPPAKRVPLGPLQEQVTSEAPAMPPITKLGPTPPAVTISSGKENATVASPVAISAAQLAYEASLAELCEDVKRLRGMLQQRDAEVDTLQQELQQEKEKGSLLQAQLNQLSENPRCTTHQLEQWCGAAAFPPADLRAIARIDAIVADGPQPGTVEVGSLVVAVLCEWRRRLEAQASRIPGNLCMTPLEGDEWFLIDFPAVCCEAV